jgi:aminoglycoside 3-N-acetyltransferase
MNNVTKIKKLGILKCFSALLTKGDDVFIHSSLSGIGDLEGGAEGIIETILDIIGREEGTLVFPTATTSFARTGFFDVNHSVSEVGAMSELFRVNYAAKRSKVPMYSFAAVGKNYLDYTSNFNGFLEEGSPLLNLISNKGKVILLGVDYNKCSLYHLSEERMKVSYNFYKTFSGVIRNEKGLDQKGSQKYFVRKDLETHKEVNWVGEILESRGEVKEYNLGTKLIKSFLAEDFDDLCMEVLTEDVMSFIER